MQAIRDAPPGYVYVLPARGVGGFYVGLREVSCADYSAFVRAGGYQTQGLWDDVAWPRVGRFVDRTGRPLSGACTEA